MCLIAYDSSIQAKKKKKEPPTHTRACVRELTAQKQTQKSTATHDELGNSQNKCIPFQQIPFYQHSCILHMFYVNEMPSFERYMCGGGGRERERDIESGLREKLVMSSEIIIQKKFNLYYISVCVDCIREGLRLVFTHKSWT